MKSTLKNYTFSTSAKTVTLTDVATVRLDRLYLIVDVTTNQMLYNFADSSVAIASVSGSVITLSGLPAGLSNSDKLLIVYDADTADAAFNDSVSSVKQNSSITDRFASDTAITISLASLANSATGVGRQSTLIDNTVNRYSSAVIYLSVKVGTTPTANSPIYVYLLRSNNNAPVVDDGAGTADAGITVVNASLLGVLNCSATTTGAVYSGTFDTSLLGALGPKWGIAVVNNTGVALDATESNHTKTFIGTYKGQA